MWLTYLNTDTALKPIESLKYIELIVPCFSLSSATLDCIICVNFMCNSLQFCFIYAALLLLCETKFKTFANCLHYFKTFKFCRSFFVGNCIFQYFVDKVLFSIEKHLKCNFFLNLIESSDISTTHLPFSDVKEN